MRAKTPQRVKIKMCGMTTAADALLAARLGVDAVGFIFYKKSPRHITLQGARAIIAKLPPLLARIGVFVNERVERINAVVEACGLDYVQLHGDETPSFCRAVRCKVIKAVRVRDAASVRALSRYETDGFLVDAFAPDQYGGTGQTCDWRLAKLAMRHGPVILAGGLNPDNAALAIKKTRPFAVDVCSGVEKSPGRKDQEKMQRFVQAVWNAWGEK